MLGPAILCNVVGATRTKSRVSNGKISLTQKESETENERMLRGLESHLDMPARVDVGVAWS
jgi:hypothetical protein